MARDQVASKLAPCKYIKNYSVLEKRTSFDIHRPENRPIAKALSRMRDEEQMASGQVSPEEMQRINGGAVRELFRKGNAKVVWQPLPKGVKLD